MVWYPLGCSHCCWVNHTHYPSLQKRGSSIVQLWAVLCSCARQRSCVFHVGWPSSFSHEEILRSHPMWYWLCHREVDILWAVVWQVCEGLLREEGSLDWGTLEFTMQDALRLQIWLIWELVICISDVSITIPVCSLGGGVVPSKGSRFSTFSHCHAVQEMYDKSLLATWIKRVWAEKCGSVCEGTTFCL